MSGLGAPHDYDCTCARCESRREPPIPEEPQAWQTYDLTTEADGSITGTAHTNDDNDDGYPDPEDTSWTVRYRNRAEMMERTGGTHTGCSGIHVLVYLDGKEIKR